MARIVQVNGELTQQKVNDALAKVRSDIASLENRVETTTGIQPSCHVSRTSEQTISTATWTAVTWEVEDHDNATMWAVGNAERITFTEEGLYCMGANILFDSNATGDRLGIITINTSSSQTGNDIYAHDRRVASSAPNNTLMLQPITTRQVSEGDYIAVQVYQDSGGNLDILAASRLDSAEFWAFQISSVEAQDG